MTAHIAMVGTTAPSHIYPSLGVMRELVRRGHRVSYTVGDSLAGLVESAGVDPVPHRSIWQESDWPDDPGAAMQMLLDEAIATLPLLIAHFGEDRPDVVLHDTGALTGPVLAHRYGVPGVVLSPSVVAWDGFEADNPGYAEAMTSSESGRAYTRALNAWLAENGIQLESGAVQVPAGPTLALIPRVMQPNADRVPASVRFVGPCLDPDRLAENGWSPPENGRRVLLVSFGTTYTEQLPIYRACVTAFADSNWHVVLVIGNSIDRAELGVLPDNIEVHPTVPQLAVLDHASAFITHAGMGGCTEALWFGVPAVAVPQGWDQFGNAAQLADIGAGIHLPAERITPDALRAAVSAVSDDREMAERLATIRAELHAGGGVAAAADAVEEFLSARRLCG